MRQWVINVNLNVYNLTCKLFIVRKLLNAFANHNSYLLLRKFELWQRDEQTCRPQLHIFSKASNSLAIKELSILVKFS